MFGRWLFAILLSVMSIAACAEAEVADLPGSANFPLVAGSAIAPCPPDWLHGSTGQVVCVSAPNNESGDAVVTAYQQILDKHGFRFGRYLDSQGVVMLTRHTGGDCDIMIFGLPYLPPEQRTRLLIMFDLQEATEAGCVQVEREGGR